MTEHDFLELCARLSDMIVEAHHGLDCWETQDNGDVRYTPDAQETFDDAMYDVEQLVRKATNYDG